MSDTQWITNEPLKTERRLIRQLQLVSLPAELTWDLPSSSSCFCLCLCSFPQRDSRLEPPSPSGVTEPPHGEQSVGERWECDDVSRRCHWALINTEDRKWGETHRGRGRWYWGDRTKNSSWVNSDPSHQPPLLLLGSKLRSDFCCLTRTLITTRELILTSVTDQCLSSSTKTVKHKTGL